jgi:O-antigen/teichoic acid export membrane protein
VDTKSSPPSRPNSPSPDSYGAVTVRSSAALTIAKALRYGLVFAVQAVLMNLMAPDEFGLMKYVTIILGIVNLIVTAGLNTAIVQKKELRDDEIGPLFTLNLLVCACLFVPVFMGAPLIAAVFGEKELTALVRVGALIIPIGGISTVHRALLQREFKYGTSSIIEVISAVVSSVVSVILAFKGYGAWALCWSLFAFHLCSSVLCMAARRGVGFAFGELSQAMPLFWFSSGWVLLRLIGYVNANVGNLLVGRFFGSGMLGTYTVAFDIISIPQLGFGLVLVPVALSALSRMQDDGGRMKEAYLKVMFFTSMISAVYCVTVGLCASDLVSTITMFKPGDVWNDTATFLRYLAPMCLIYSWCGYSGLVWAAKRKIALDIVWTSAMTLATVAFIVVGSRYGPWGMCVALIVRAVAAFPILLYVMKKSAGIAIGEYVGALLPSLYCSAIAGAVCVAVARLLTVNFPVHHAIRLAACVLASSAFFAAAFAIFFSDKFKMLVSYARLARPRARGRGLQN